MIKCAINARNLAWKVPIFALQLLLLAYQLIRNSRRMNGQHIETSSSVKHEISLVTSAKADVYRYATYTFSIQKLRNQTPEFSSRFPLKRKGHQVVLSEYFSFYTNHTNKEIKVLAMKTRGKPLGLKAIPIKCFVFHRPLSLLKLGRSVGQKKKKKEWDRKRKQKWKSASLGK